MCWVYISPLVFQKSPHNLTVQIFNNPLEEFAREVIDEDWGKKICLFNTERLGSKDYNKKIPGLLE